MKKLLILSLATFLILSIVIGGIACSSTDNVDNGNNLGNGELPTLKVGDKWVVEITHEGDSYTCTVEVTGETTVDDKDCYITEWSNNPPLFGFMENMIAYINKMTYEVDVGYTTGTIYDEPISTVVTYSYVFPEETYWPLEVGKEVERIKTETAYTTYMGETETDSVTETTIFKVEKVEDITVDAGTFKCFKIVEYDEDGNKLNTYWHSDMVKQNVKEIDHEDGSTVELKSYSLH